MSETTQEPRTREESHEITYTPAGGPRTRLRFEPGETTPWVVYEAHWNAERGAWRPVGSTPAYNVSIDSGLDDTEESR